MNVYSVQALGIAKNGTKKHPIISFYQYIRNNVRYLNNSQKGIWINN